MSSKSDSLTAEERAENIVNITTQNWSIISDVAESNVPVFQSEGE